MPESPHSVLTALRRVRFPLIWLAPLFALLALGGWAFASPVGSSPDDDFHLASIWCAAGGRTSLCEAGATPTTRKVSEALLGAPCFARDSTASGACQAAVFTRTQLVESNRGNFAGQYPPLYYATMSLFASNDIQTSVIAMRLVNVILFVGIMTALTLLLPRRHLPTLLWSWLISVIPLGLFVLASINPSGWTVTGVGTAWIALLGAYETVGRRRIGLSVVFLLSTVMAVGSRADAAVYLILTVAAVVFLRFRPDRRFLRQCVLPATGVALAVLALLSSRQVNVAVDGFPPGAMPTATATATAIAHVAAPVGSTLGLLFSNLANAPSLWAGVFGSWELGWFDTKMPFLVALGGVGVFSALAFVGLGVLSWRKLLVSIATVAALWAIPVWTLTRGHESVGVDLQPRYLLPLIVVLAGFLLLRVGGRTWRLTRVQRILIIVTSSITQSLALFFTMRRFITGDDVNGFDLGAKAEWWWTGVPGPMFAWVLASLCWVALVIAVVRFLDRSSADAPTRTTSEVLT
jgi:hypothetical protein